MHCMIICSLRNALLLVLFFSPLAAQWSADKQEQLTEQARQKQKQLLVARPSFHWPFDAPTKEALRRMEQDSVPVFSYGSLLNEKSAARTLSEETLATRRPAVAFGATRRFDYDPGLERYTLPESVEERAMLNLNVTGNPDEVVNGVVVELDKEDLIALCEREIGYDLVPIVVVDWDDALSESEPTFYTAYTFRAPDTEPLGVDHVNPDLFPRRDYYQVVVEGASQFGDEYLQLWYDTTYLGDGKTPVKRWANGKSNGVR